jgi:hypothetical protein
LDLSRSGNIHLLFTRHLAFSLSKVLAIRLDWAHGLFMKADQMNITWVMLAGLALLVVLPTAARAELCGAIRSDRERLACFDRAASKTEADRNPPSPAKIPLLIVDPVDWLKAENEKLSMRLRGICRGC